MACILASIGHGDEALRNMETAMLLQPHPSSCYFEVLGCCQFAVGDFDRAIAAFQRGIEVNPSFILCRYQLAVTYGACGRIDEARAEAAIVKSDCRNMSVDYFLDPELRAIWQRGKEVAGLSQIPGALSLLGQYELALVPAAEQRLSHGLVKISALAACTLVFPRATGLLVGVLL